MTVKVTGLAIRLCIAVGCFLAVDSQCRSASAAVIYDERVDGDLPGINTSGPFRLLTLPNGVSEVRGNTGTSLELDRFDIRIASGAQLTGITYSAVDAVGDMLSITWRITNAANTQTLFSGSFSVPTVDQPLPGSLFPLGPGTYRIFDSAFSNAANPANADYSFTFTVANGPGVSQSSPILPTSQSGGVFVFTNVPSGLWCDPPLVEGFHYEMTTPGSLFTGITGFPTGFNAPFTVSSGGTVIGQFVPGQTVTFGGGGVSSFDVTGITPLADAASPTAFPLQLTFSTPTASFTMQGIEAVPEPGTIFTWAGLTLAALVGSVRVAVGEKVRVVRGLLAGLVGTVQEWTAESWCVLEVEGLPEGVVFVIDGNALEGQARD